MLVLSRKVNEKIFFTASNGEMIEIMIVEVRGGKVRVGMTAPKTVHIQREEVMDRVPSQQEVINGPHGPVSGSAPRVHD